MHVKRMMMVMAVLLFSGVFGFSSLALAVGDGGKDAGKAATTTEVAADDAGWDDAEATVSDSGDEEVGKPDKEGTGKKTGIPQWVIWTGVGVLVFFFILVVVGVILLGVMRSSQQRKSVEELRRENERQVSELAGQVSSLKAATEKLTDENQRLVAGQREAEDDGAQVQGGGKTIRYGASSLGVVLINKRNGKSLTLELHKTDSRGHVREAPKYTIGRNVGCDICLSQPTVSDKHCEIFAEMDGKVYVFDLHSSNGTRIRRAGTIVDVNGQAELQDRDELEVGDKRADNAVFEVLVMKFDVNAPSA